MATAALRGGVTIGVLCSLWMFLMGLTGWYHDPVLHHAFWLVVVIQVAVLIVALRQTAAAGAGWGRQVGTGTLISLVAGLILLCASLLFTTVIFPESLGEVQAMQAGMLRAAGKSETEIAAALAASARAQRPVVQAVSGFAGTLVTGAVASLVIGAFCRSRPAASPAA